MYRICTAAVTVALVSGLVIYSTAFIRVVTLGGVALGAALMGIGSSLIAALSHRLVAGRGLAMALQLVGNSCLMVDLAKYMPGYSLSPGFTSLSLMVALCLVIIAINEACLQVNR